MLPSTPDSAGQRVLEQPVTPRRQQHAVPPQGQGLWVMFLVVWVATVTYAAVVLRWGWVPRDDGFLAHAAERVLRGEIPHRNFQDVYVGLLSYLHAAAFRIWGTNLGSLRYPLLAIFVLWVPSVFWIASRMLGRTGTAIATIIAAVWCIPNYSASMPSWYNLFFATFGLAAIFRYIEVESPWLLLLAGFSAAISCLFKITGLYFVAAVFLFLVWQARPNPSASSTRARLDRGLVSLFAVLFVTAVALLLRSRLGASEIYHFLAPQVAIAAFLLWFIWRPARQVHENLPAWNLVRTLGPFSVGFLLPIAAFEIAFASMGAVRDLLNGVFLLPMRRLAVVGRSPAPLISLVPMCLTLGLVIAAGKFRGRRLWFINAPLVIGFAALLFLSANSPAAFTFSWYIFAPLIPAIVVISVVALRQSAGDSVRDQRLMLLAGTVAVCSLIQYPFSTAAYFCYVAPLLVLLVAQLLAVYPVSRSTIAIICAFAVLFPIIRLRPFMERDGFSHINLVPLQLARAGGLEVRADQAQDYEQLVRVIQQHVRPGSFIYVAPDDAQIYFLAEMRNPTRLTYSSLDEPRGQTQRILQGLAAHDVRLVVIDTALSSSAPADLLQELNSLFPDFASVGQFQVRWRE
jgi:hypothetical protein